MGGSHPLKSLHCNFVDEFLVWVYILKSQYSPTEPFKKARLFPKNRGGQIRSSRSMFFSSQPYSLKVCALHRLNYNNYIHACKDTCSAISIILLQILATFIIHLKLVFPVYQALYEKVNFLCCVCQSVTRASVPPLNSAQHCHHYH